MIPTYSGCWLTKLSGGLPLASYDARSTAFTDCPSPWASTERKAPKVGAETGGGDWAAADPGPTASSRHTATKARPNCADTGAVFTLRGTEPSQPDRNPRIKEDTCADVRSPSPPPARSRWPPV